MFVTDGAKARGARLGWVDGEVLDLVPVNLLKYSLQSLICILHTAIQERLETLWATKNVKS